MPDYIGSEAEICPISSSRIRCSACLADQVAALDQSANGLPDLIGREFSGKFTDNPPKTLSGAYRYSERRIELAMKEELPMLGIEANDVIWQSIDRKVRRELEDIAVNKLRNAAAVISR